MTFRRRLMALSVLAAFLAAAAFAIFADIRPAQAQNRKVKIAYGVVVVDPSTAPWLSAGKTGGFWQEEGLDVEVVGFSGAAPAVQLLAKGDVDIVVTGTPDMMRLREEGVPILTVANIYDRMHVYPVVLENSPIKSVEDFRGKKVGMQTLTGSPMVWTNVFLKANGMTTRDLGGAIGVGTGAAAVQAIKNGQVDILVEWHGHYALLETQFGMKFRRFDSHPVLKQNAFVHAVFASERAIKEDPKMVLGVIRGIAKGIIFSKTNPKAAAKGHFEQFPRTLPQGVPYEQALNEAAEVIAKNVEMSMTTTNARQWGLATQQQVEGVRDILLEAGILKKKLDWTEYYTPQFIKAANDFDVDAVVRKAQAMK